jgi:NADH-quinone oxidoreductase subunit J
MDIHPIAFYLFAVLAIAFSFMVVFRSNPVSSAFSLIMVFFCFAGIYASLEAHLIAAFQVLVYAGAIMVLFVFVIMLLDAAVPSFDLGRTHIAQRVLSVFGGFLLLSALVFVFKDSQFLGLPGNFSTEQIVALGGNTKVSSTLLFSDALLPFEMTSILLLGAIVGAIALAKRNGRNPK